MSVTCHPSYTTTCLRAPQALDAKMRPFYPTTDTEKHGGFRRHLIVPIFYMAMFISSPSHSVICQCRGGSQLGQSYCPRVIDCVYNSLVFGYGVYILTWHRGEAKRTKGWSLRCLLVGGRDQFIVYFTSPSTTWSTVF